MIKRFLCILYIILILLVLASSAFGTVYIRYVDSAIPDNNPASATPDCTNYNTSTFACSGGSESVYVSARDVALFLASLSADDTATVYYRKGQTWVIDASNERPTIDTNNVTLTTFGSGAKPILDGQNTDYGGFNGYPIVKITGGITNITINGLEIKNAYSSGIGLQGLSSSAGDITISNCYIHTIGYAAINAYGWKNNIGTITVNNNEIADTGNYPEANGGGWPAAVSGVNLVAKYNVLYNVYGEGITCSGGDCTVEYNNVSDIRNPSIYIDPWQDDPGTINIRYNLVWYDSDGTFNGSSQLGVRLDDENEAGDNTSAIISIYGNVVVGESYSGIDLRNNPLDGTGYSNWGNVYIYGNTLIDNNRNMVVAYNDRYDNVVIKNNTSIIHSDAESACVHIADWSNTSWENWTWGANHWYGDTDPGTPYTDNGEFGTDPKLGKTSGWRSITSIPSLDDFTPQDESALIDNSNTDSTIGAEYDDYITTGEFSDLPDTESLTTGSQGDYGSDWDFGAIIPDLIVTVTATDDTATEENTTTGQWTISCSPDCAGETINFSYSGSAILNTDYNTDDEDGSKTITGASATITLTPVDDDIQDVGETATLTIDSGTGYTVGSPSSANISIVDNDGAQDQGIAGITVDASGSGNIVYDSTGSGSWSR